MNLKNAIDDYLKNRFINYALLIKGGWGSGKTFFVKKNVVKRYNNALYISLYGISSIDKFSEKIYLEILRSKATTNCVSKLFRNLHERFIFKILFFIPIIIFRILKFLYESLFRLIWIITHNLINLKFNIDISSMNKKDFYGVLKMYKKLNKYILVIDDLERCSIPIEEILGFINDFVEHNNMKCILIANEEEICRVQTENLELKILTAITEKIEFCDNNTENNKKSNESNEKLDINNLKNRIEYLYNENNKYKIIKEKLVGKEFLFIPELENVYDNLAFKYRNIDDFYDILNHTKFVVLNALKLNNFNNIRTLDFYFDNFYYIYKYIHTFVKQCKISEDYIYNDISSSIINGCISIKKGYGIKLLPKDKKFDYISYSNDKASLFQTNMFLTFDFVNEYLVFNYIESSNIEETLTEFANSNCDKLPDDDPFNLLNEYWYYSSEQLDDILHKIYVNIKANNYNPLLYTLILKKIACLEAMGYSNQIVESIVEILVEKVSSINDCLIDDYEHFLDDKASTIYSDYIHQINDKIKKRMIITKTLLFDEILEKDDWAIEFYEYVVKIKKQTILEKKFFSTLDYKKIVQKLFNSDIKNIYYFKYSLDKIYSFDNLRDYYATDLESLRLFRNDLVLKVKKVQDSMLKYPFKLLLEKVDYVISRLDA